MTSSVIELANLTSEDMILLEKARTGQRLAIGGILIHILGLLILMGAAVLLSTVNVVVPLPVVIGFIMLVLLAGFITSLVGVYRMARGLKISMVMTVLMLILIFIAPLNLLIVGLLSERTNLKAHGYKVGLLGARRLDS
jgi:dipeptide/tripeptide permease